MSYFDPLRGIVLRPSGDDGMTFPLSREAVISLPGENVALEAPSCIAAGDGVLIAYGVDHTPVSTGASPAVDVAVVDTRSASAGRRAVRLPDSAMYHPRIVSESELVAIVSKRGEARGAVEIIELPGGQRSALTRPQPFVARRSELGWCGDYFGVATWERSLLLASCDAASGNPQIAFVRTPIP